MNGKKIQDKIIQVISKNVQDLAKEHNIDSSDVLCSIEIPANKQFGDFATNIAMKSCKFFRKPPIEVGELIKQKLLQDNEAQELFSEINVVVPGFINFFVKNEILYLYLNDIKEKGDSYGKSNIGSGKKVNIEFISANPTGPLHVGHGRGAALGDILASLYEFSGFDVTREYYINDCGRQIEILGRTVEAWIEAFEHGIEPDFEQKEGEELKWYKGKYMREVTLALLDRFGHNHTTRKFGFYAGEIILENIKEDLQHFGVRDFDVWFSEKTLHDSSKIEEVVDGLEKDGLVYDHDDAKWFKSSVLEDDKDRVIQKSNGDLTYLAADIAYHKDKVDRGFDKLVNIWGADHHGYVPRIKSAIKAFGSDPEKLSVILCQLVRLMRGGEPVPMSTRSGEFISLREVIDEVGKDVARFFFIMRKFDAQFDFDLELAKKHSLDNPVYYIQYAHARICSIFKHQEENDKINYQSNNIKFGCLKEKEELDIIKNMINFQDMIEGAVLNNEPHRVTSYLQELASSFHSFYNKHKVVSDDQDLSSARLFLIDALRIVIKNGLGVLGIQAVHEM